MASFRLAALAPVLMIAAVPQAAAQSSGLAVTVPQPNAGATPSPHSPAPPAAQDAGPRQYLIDARMALREGRTGAAREALERAETRLLDRADAPAPQEARRARLLQSATAARQALEARDPKGAIAILDNALASRMVEAALPPRPIEPELAYPPVADVPAPAHWQPAHMEWRGAWVNVPGHWE